MSNKRWIPFYFDGNQAWGQIDTPEEWERIKHSYKDSSCNLAESKSNPKRDTPCFGLYPEYKGELSLGEFAEENGMDIGYKRGEVKDEIKFCDIPTKGGLLSPMECVEAIKFHACNMANDQSSSMINNARLISLRTCTDLFEYYNNQYSNLKHEPKTVTLSNLDIVDLANDLAKTNDSSQGGTEYFIKEWIKRTKNIDFFPED